MKTNINEELQKSFSDFNIDERIIKALDALGYDEPMEVQVATIEKILDGKDLLVQSQTGSGKTAAFAIPLCEKIDVEEDSTQVLVIAPTRELAVQVKDEINSIGKGKGIRTLAVYGKESIVEQKNEIKKRPHVIVSTPGRMVDHIIRRNIKLDTIKYFVIDEVDEMLLMGFMEQVETIIEKLPKDRVTLMFSATIPEKVEYLSKSYMNDPELIEVQSKRSNLKKISQLYYAVDGLSKVDFMKKMIKKEMPRKAIIFCNTRDQVDRLYDILKKWDPLTCAIHGGLEQKARLEIINGFKSGQFKIMIATDVAARGIHVKNLTHIINYSVPFENEQYIHRIGRTGRVDKSGVAISIVMPSEMERFEKLQEFLGYEIPCKGGMVPKPVSKKKIEAMTKNQRYKVDSRRKNKAIVEINAGYLNNKLKSGLLLSLLRGIPGITQDDIGKIDVRDKISRFEVYDSKETIIVKALNNRKIKGFMYKAKRIK